MEQVQVLKDAEHGVATAWLCREEKRNALGAPVLRAIEYGRALLTDDCVASVLVPMYFR
jgi:enoyl-CoA hydratase/carnithine racemase